MNGPQTEAELEEYLSRPTESDIAHAAGLAGDVLILGAGGKMGPSLARLAKRAGARVIAVARFTDRELPARLQADGIETIACDMLETGALAKLPDAPNVIFMAARKFGTAGAEYLTWAMNTFLPGLVAERYRDSRIVAFSTGNVYPLAPVESGGAMEMTAPAPMGEYAQSALGRERMFEYGAARWGTQAAILRLNYAVEMRYGVLADIGRAVFERRPVDVGMGFVNVVWQRDANSVAFRALSACANPPLVLNLTGPETLSTREIAVGFGNRFGVEPVFQGTEGSHALLNNAARCHERFGYPTVTPETLMDWVAEWIKRGNSQWNKPTHFEVRDGEILMDVRARLLKGMAIPAHPLALTAARKLDEKRQRALTRYYLAAGAGGVAVGVHTTQFAIHDPKVGLLRPVLEIGREEAADAVTIAGVCGVREQAVREAELARSLGYDAGLVSLAALRDASEDELIDHCRAVASIIPVVGFYLQPAVGGRILPYSFWRRFVEIRDVVAIKIAPFNRYQTIDVVRAVAESGRAGEIALYTGNDDNIVADLVTEFDFGGRRLRIVGGLLGHWAVWTRHAVTLLEDAGPKPLTSGAQITDANAAVFDAANQFRGCIPGIHEVLRRQGLLAGRWCFDEHEELSPGQSEEIDRVTQMYPHLCEADDQLIAENLDRWLR